MALEAVVEAMVTAEVEIDGMIVKTNNTFADFGLYLKRSKLFQNQAKPN